MPIDDAIEKIKQGITDDGDDVLDALVQTGATFSPLIAVYAACRAVFNTADSKHRVATAIRALCDELYAIRAALPANAEKVLTSTWFRKATRVVMEEAARADDEDRAVLLALVAVHGCVPESSDAHRRQDLASYLSDLARLGTDDTVLLRLICEAHKEAVQNSQSTTDPNIWNNHYGTLKQMTDRNNLHPDDCLAVGLRLTGFGLAFHTEDGGVHHQGELRFRPTRRGVYLFSLLKKAEASMNARRRPSGNA